MSNINDLQSVDLKAGRSFFETATITQDGVPLNINGMTLESELRTLDNTLVETLNITIADALNGIVSIAPVDTSVWTVGRLLWDVKVTRAGQIIYTNTVAINVTGAVTS